ncbi:DUF3887 domain-containing protein [Leifsonia poae]|uniref:DUF3887 domain-containing protein n=1 Tax=Leifsonia poae TaxID=110933 RepID=UPI001CBE661C|nr:DUF3887 domain-containing protein [Leifsonia poae]
MSDSFSAAAGRLHRDLETILAAPVLRSESDPLDALQASLAVQSRAAELVASAVEHARSSGRTWQEIGDALGVSRQAAFQRYGRPIDPRTGETMNTTPLPEATDLAVTVVDDLTHARWAAVADRFDTTVRSQLGPDGLAAAWAQIVGLAGAYESHGDITATRMAEYTVTDTPLAFEAGDFIARVSFRDDKTIAGLYILPAEVAPLRPE